MPAYVASLMAALEDGVSANAAAATDSLGRMADAADSASTSLFNTSTVTTKAGQSAAALTNAYDPATKAASTLQAAQNKLAAAQETMAAAVASGSKTQAQADAVTAALSARVQAAQKAVEQLGISSSEATKQISGVGDANAEAANQANVASGAHAGFYREIVILGHEVVTGNFNRIPGSLLVLAERSGNLDTIFKGVINTVTSLPGVLAIGSLVGVAAFTAMAISADNADNRLLHLQTTLRATRDDYVAIASEATAAGRVASQQTPGLARSDAIEAAGTIAASPQFDGTQQQLTALTETAANMGAVFGETVDKAATALAQAMQAPGDAADKLVGKLRGMDQATADSIKLMDEAGDKAGAFARLLDVENAATSGATSQLSPLRQALRDLTTAFDDTNAAGTKAGGSMGTAFQQAAVTIVEAAASITKALSPVFGYLTSHDITGKLLPQYAPGAATANAYGDKSLYANVAQMGQQTGLTPQQIALAQSVTMAESGGRQFTTGGSLVTSGIGGVDAPVGAMQVKPSTAAQFGEDPTTIPGNLSAGEQYLKQLWTKYGGDQQLITMAYNWGPGNVDKWIASGKPPDGVPAETSKYVSTVANGGVSTGGDGQQNAAGVANTDTGVMNQALQASGNSLGAQFDATTAKIALLKTALADLDTQGVDHDTQRWIKLSTELNATQLQLSNLVSPTTKVAETLDRTSTSQASLTAAYGVSYGAVAEATAHNQALAEAYQTVGDKSDHLGEVTALLTPKYLEAAQAAGALAIAQTTLGNKSQGEYLTAEITSLHDNVAARDVMLARLKAEQDLRVHNVSDLSAEGKAYLASADDITTLTDQLAVAQQSFANKDQIEFLNAETSSLGMNDAARQKLLDTLKAEQFLRSKNIGDLSTEGKAYLASVSDLSAATASYAQQQQSLQELDSFASNSFNTIGNAITQAFTQGAGSAVSFGSIVKGVMSSVLQEVVKLGAIDPLLNNLLGGERPTLDSVSGLLGQSSGGGGLASVGGVLGQLFGAGSAAPAVGTVTQIGSASLNGSLGPITSQTVPAVGGGGSILGGAALGIGAGSLINSFAGGNSLGGSAGSAIGSIAGSAIGSIIPGVGTLIGGLIGGIGGGLLGGLFGNNKPSDKTEYTKANLATGASQNLGNQPGGSEYNAQNVQAAANLSSAVYGGEQDITQAFGLKDIQQSFESKVGSRDGIFVRFDNGTQFNADNTTAGATQVTNQAVGDIVTQLKTGFDSTTVALLKGIDYSQSNAKQLVSTLAGALTGGKLDATQKLALPNISTTNAAQGVSDLDWIKNTYEPAVNAAGTGSLAAQIETINKSFASLTSTAERLGLSTTALNKAQTQQIADANTAAAQTVAASAASIKVAGQTALGETYDASVTSATASGVQQQQQLTAEFKGLYGSVYAANADYVAQMAGLNRALADQQQALATAHAQLLVSTEDQTEQTFASNSASYYKAAGQVYSYSSDPGTQQAGRNLSEQGDLWNFDAQAKTATDAYQAQLLNTYGQGFASSTEYATLMVAQEKSLAEQRLAIQAQYTAAAAQAQSGAESAASGVVSGLSTFASSLALGSASPLNAQNQYQLAQSTYQTDITAAQGGDAKALGLVQNDASAFLTASQNVNGSGAQYASDFAGVVNALNALANVSQSALTQSFMTQLSQTSTQVLAAAIAGLQATMTSVKTELAMANARP